MIDWIKEMIGLKRLEQNHRELEDDLTGLTELIQKLAERQVKLEETIQNLENTCRNSSKRLDKLSIKVRSLEEDLPAANTIEELMELTKKLKDISDQLKKLEDDNTPDPSREANGLKDSGTSIQTKLAQLPKSLTKAVKVLFNSEGPLTYEEIAKRMEKKPATARSYIYRLKERSFPLQFINREGEKKKVKLPLKVRRQLTVPE
jgi:predicted  nucleic acid-binding Zn-ribbon protein